jgi:outer membrane protein
LDVSFARVNLAEAELLLLQTRNDVQAAFAGLSAAMGMADSAAYDLADEPLAAAPPVDSGPLVAQALRERPDLVSARLANRAAATFADAERGLWMPTVSAVATAGVVPYRESALRDRYAAVGVNVNVPLSNGGLFNARSAGARLRARAEEQRVRDVENRIARDVRTAWLNARTAFERMGLTDQLLSQATDAADLVQARYDLGLSSIVELSEAQLRKTQAEIQQATARYDFQIGAAVLRFQTGAIR